MALKISAAFLVLCAVGIFGANYRIERDIAHPGHTEKLTDINMEYILRVAGDLPPGTIEEMFNYIKKMQDIVDHLGIKISIIQRMLDGENVYNLVNEIDVLVHSKTPVTPHEEKLIDEIHSLYYAFLDYVFGQGVIPKGH